MFGTLFLKECKQVYKSITYYIFVLCMVLFCISQLGTAGIQKPQESSGDYGFTYSKDESVIMKKTLDSLLVEYERNSYSTYPFGFYKNVVLSESKQEKIEDVLEYITGMSIEEIKQSIDDYWDKKAKEVDNGVTFNYGVGIDFGIKPLAELNFKQFEIEMIKIVDIIGKGSSYEIIEKNAYVPRTYEEALEEYRNILKYDKVSGAFARIFADYMGILLAILPVFLSVTRGLRDKRSNAAEVIFSKKVSSISIILSRYLATVVMILIPLLILSITPALQSLYSAKLAGSKGDAFVFLKVILFWILPTSLVSVSVGFFLTELTNGPIGIFVQGVWWFISIFLSRGDLIGNVGWNLIPRFNTVGSYDKYQEILKQLMYNRIFYTGVGMFLLGITVLIYSYKRKGVLHFNGKILPSRKS